MKFTDGYWLMRPGVSPYYPAEAYEITSDDASLTILAPTRPVQGRGDPLNIPALANL